MKHRKITAKSASNEPESRDANLVPDLSKEQAVRMLSRFTNEPMSSRTEVVYAFKEMASTIRKMLGHDYWRSPSFAAIQVLLETEEKGDLDFNELGALLRNGINVGTTFYEFAGAPIPEEGNLKPPEGIPFDRKAYVSGIKSFSRDNFLDGISFLLKALDNRSRKRAIKSVVSDYALEGSFVPESHRDADEGKHRVYDFESELLADTEFCPELIKVVGIVNADLKGKKWEYNHRNGKLFIVDEHNRRTQSSGGTLNELSARDGMLSQFCQDWCVACVSNFRGSSEVDGAWFSAPRLTVRYRGDELGYEVFIPRFYKFNEIDAYKDTDFRPLRATMTCLHAGNFWTNKFEKADAFRKLKKDFIAEGLNEDEAVRKAKKRIRLSDSTLRSLVGLSQSSKRSNQEAAGYGQKGFKRRFGDAEDAHRVP